MCLVNIIKGWSLQTVVLADQWTNCALGFLTGVWLWALGIKPWFGLTTTLFSFSSCVSEAERESPGLCACPVKNGSNGVKRHFWGILWTRSKTSVTATAPLTSACDFLQMLISGRKSTRPTVSSGTGVGASSALGPTSTQMRPNVITRWRRSLTASKHPVRAGRGTHRPGSGALMVKETGWGLSLIPIFRRSLSGWIFSH